MVSQAQVLPELQALQQKEQMGMVLVTHNLAVLEQMADWVAVLKDGNIVEQGDKDGFDHPKRTNIQKNLLYGCAGKREERCIIITCAEVNNLSKNFAGTAGKRNLPPWTASFTLDAGECLGLIGERADAEKARRRRLSPDWFRRMQAAFCWKARKSSEEKAGGSAKFGENTDGLPDPAGFFDPMQTLETDSGSFFGIRE